MTTPTLFRKPDGLIGRFAVVKPWPDTQAAEDENIARLQITARALGLECIVVDPEGMCLEAPYQRVTDREVDFVIHLHFETPKAYDAFSLVTLWNPLRFFRDWGYRRFSRNLITHDDFLSCSSTWADDHVRRMLRGDPTRLPPFFTMYHSLSEPIVAPTLGAQKVFYAGINWEKFDKSKKGRHQDLLRLLDNDGILRIHGPKIFNGVDVWDGYKTYVGPLPFDGVSVVDAIAQAGISLVFSSDAHRESELMSNRLFESLAAGAVIICDGNPFARRHFGDHLLYVDSLAPKETVRAQILAHLDWIRREPAAALAKACAAQAVFKERFTLDRSLISLYEQLPARKAALNALHAPLQREAAVTLLLLLPEYSEHALGSLLSSVASQRLVNLRPVLLADAWDCERFGAEISRAIEASGVKVEVRPLDFVQRRADGTRVQRSLLGRVLAPVIEGIPADAQFMIVAPNEELFSEHVATLARALQSDERREFAYAPVVLRHVLDSKFVHDLLPELNITSNSHLPPGFGRYLFRRSAVRGDQLEAMRYLDFRALGPLVGELAGGSSSRATLFQRIQEPFITHELMDATFEHEIVLEHLRVTPTPAATDVGHAKPVLAHIASNAAAGVAPSTVFQAFVLSLVEAQKPNPAAVKALRTLRQTAHFDRVYDDAVYGPVESAIVGLRKELGTISDELMATEKCDSLLAYCLGLCFDANGQHLEAFRMFNRAVMNAASHTPAHYRVRAAMKSVRLALNAGEADKALMLIESLVLKLQPKHPQARALLADLKAGAAPRALAKTLASGAARKGPPQAKTAAAKAAAGETKRRPLVSALVSTHGAERFMRGCLEDLERQTIAKDLEIIVVDSASPQSEGAIVKEFQRRFSNIVYVRTEERETVYGAWNRAIQLARGKYLTNANTDDRHRVDAFELLARALDQNPNAALVYADCHITRTENETFETAQPVGHYRWLEFDRLDLLNKGCFVGPQPMWRREVHEEHGLFDASFVTAGDYEFWLRLATTRNFLHVNETLGLYLDSPTSVEHANRQRGVEESTRAREKHRATILRAAAASPASNAPPAAATASVRAVSAPRPACVSLASLDEARALLARKDLPAAWTATRATLARRPFHPAAYLLLAEIALAAGDASSARRCAQHARDLAPGFTAARKFLKRELRGMTRPAWLALPEEISAGESARKPRLSVCLIVKNEERFLGRCLASVRGLADQIVVVDTGSTDRTIAIAQEHGAEVHPFPWCDDFSAARNAALEHATGDWILVLDADEELPAASHAALRKEMREAAVMAWRLPIVDAGREDDGRAYVPRLFRNAPGLYFSGRVHEHAFGSVEERRQEWGLDNRLGSATLLHHGYSKELTEERGKVGRNLRLLEIALQESPATPLLLMNLGLELTRSGRIEESLTHYEAAFAAMSAEPAAAVVPELREMLLLQYASALTTAKRHAETVRVLGSPLARQAPLTASLHYLLGMAHVEQEEFREATEQMRQCLAKRDLPTLTPVNPEIRKAAPRHCLALCHGRLKEIDAALREFEQAVRETPASVPLQLDYAKFLGDNGRIPDALQMLHRLTNEQPGVASIWICGGRIALSRPELLDLALEWTGVALQHLPDDPDIVALRAEALLLSGQTQEALPLWRTVAAESHPARLAARILCETALGIPACTPSEDLVEAVTKEFLAWYWRLVEMRNEALVLQLLDRVEQVTQLLPGAAEVLQTIADELKTPVAN